MNTKTGILTATLSGAVVLIGVQAYANTQAFFTRTGNFTFTAAADVPLNNAGATEVTFSGTGRRTITYTAECSKTGTTGSGWVTIAIIVDGAELAPTGGNTGDAFCSANTTSGDDGWVMAAAQGRTVNFSSDGPHTVRIRASLGGFLPSGQGSLGDSALDISR
jgi:hypothetical protein